MTGLRQFLTSYRLDRGEISGGLGDLGVLIPLEAALVAINGLNPTTTLVGVGLVYILAGAYFRLPIPVQPLKAFAIIALALEVAPSVIAAGALLMSAILAALALTGGVSLLDRLIPRAVVRGMQFALGLILLRNALLMWVEQPFFIGGERLFLDLGPGAVPGGLVLGLGGLFLISLRFHAFPASLAVLLLGAATGVALGSLGGMSVFHLGPAAMAPPPIQPGDFATALVVLVIPQLPLTVTNAVIATAETARDYFGPQAHRATPRRLSLSIAAANLWAGLLGGLPTCHGSGGLTAHYRLGARTPAATALLGLALIALGLLFGHMALPLRALIPFGSYGTLLAYVGWEHLRLGFKVGERRYLAIVLLMGALSFLPGSNLAYAATGGMVAFYGAQGIAYLGQKCLRRGGSAGGWTGLVLRRFRLLLESRRSCHSVPEPFPSSAIPTIPTYNCDAR